MRRLVIVSILAVAVVLTGCAEASVDGPTLYRRHCAACHSSGPAGSVGPAIGPGTPAARQSDQQLEDIIVNGAEGMPGLSLEPGPLEALIAYIRLQQAG